MWPLLGVALEGERIAKALDYASLLLRRPNSTLLQPLFMGLAVALEAGEREQLQIVQPLLHQALAVARDLGYLSPVRRLWNCSAPLGTRFS